MTRRRKAAIAAVVVALASIASGAFLTIAPPASSQIATVRTEVGIDRQGWYWQENQRVAVPGTGVQQELFPAPAQQHHLQVGLLAGAEDKRAYVGFDVLFTPGFVGGTVRSFDFSFEVSQPTSDHLSEHLQQAQESQTPPVPPSTFNDASAALVACPVTTFLADGADGDPMQDVEGNRIEPQFDCREGMAQGRRSDDGTKLTFDLTQIAAAWTSGDSSDAAIVIKPAPEAPQPPAPESTWTVEFHGRQLDALAASMSYTPAGITVAPPPPPPQLPPGGSTTSVEEFGGQETRVSAVEPEPEAAPAPAAPPFGEPQPRYPWWAYLPWIGGAVALALAYYALREPHAGAGQHNVAELLRRRRLTGAPT
ncbi:MAG TPA: hypothetical protein VFA34_01555 [Actinomycetota bacterium]|jgi:hypothetical protein|nr:hypothetical protein [Actinomycetota bacterium]